MEKITHDTEGDYSLKVILNGGRIIEAFEIYNFKEAKKICDDILYSDEQIYTLPHPEKYFVFRIKDVNAILIEKLEYD